VSRKLVQISEAATLLREQVDPSSLPDQVFHHYSLPAYDSGGKPVRELGSEIMSNKFRVMDGVVLISKLNPFTPRIWKVKNVPDINSVASTEFLVLRPKPGITLDELYLICCSRELTEHLSSLAGGTSNSHQRVRPAEIMGATVSVPSGSTELKFAAESLAALDDKIELNRKMNVTLEQIAKALFKSWFVDFDPVHAKAAGRQPTGMDKATADLFPDSFVDSELGKIPSGWKAGSLSNLSKFSRDSINPGETPSEIFDHYSLPSFDEGKVPKTEEGSEIKSNKLVVTKTCVLLSKLNPHIPRIWLPNLRASRRSICSTEFIVASAIAGCTREYLYALFISEDFSRTYGTLVTGTTGSHQRIKAESVLQMRIPVPPAELISSFTDTMAPMINRVAINTKELQALAELRDTLLPQLLNGELKAA
jgi:type I restriction enzyme S subunit